MLTRSRLREMRIAIFRGEEINKDDLLHLVEMVENLLHKQYMDTGVDADGLDSLADGYKDTIDEQRSLANWYKDTIDEQRLEIKDFKKIKEEMLDNIASIEDMSESLRATLKSMRASFP